MVPILAEGRHGSAIKFSGDNSVICKGSGAFKRTDPFSFSSVAEARRDNKRAPSSSITLAHGPTPAAAATS